MKKLFFKILTFALCISCIFGTLTLSGCGKTADLRIYNCYEYIDESLIDDFVSQYKEKTGLDITVEYSCFDTPEDLYNNLKIYPDGYDLVCPSDYMIEKMAREDMLEKFTLPADGAYNKNLSPFVKSTFESIAWGENNLSQYAAGYMWGTLGLCYNPANVDEADMKSWSTLWGTKYKGKFSVKNSIRDTYFISLSQIHKTELESLKSQASSTEKKARLTAIFNDTSDSTITQMESVISTVINNAYGTEIDEGKDLIIQGKTDVYFAWSGDAVYAMDEGDASNVTLNYTVPEEGSNVWFDGWCVPKGAKNKALALEFIDFISTPENVIKNMEYIGYVSCIGGAEVFNWVTETYGDATGENQVNLDYFFKGENDAQTYLVSTSSLNRQFSAQYPDESVLDRCVVMSYYPDAQNEAITNMWMNVNG